MSKLADTIQNVTSLLLQDIINLKHYWDYRKTKNPKSEELAKIGYVKLNDFIPKAKCDELYKQVIAFCEKYPTTTTLDNGAKIHYRSEGVKTGPDAGMIDIYNIDREIDLNINFQEIEDIIRGTSTNEIYFTSVHAYINRGVEGTRIFHVDNCQPVVYKAFLYLTDVSSTDYGPYAFIKGSHRFSPQVYGNLIKNLFIKKYRSPDMPAYNKKNEIIALGERGSLIISNQNGIHRGYPQAKNKERVALVLTYMVVSRVNYIHHTAKSSLSEALKKI